MFAELFDIKYYPLALVFCGAIAVYGAFLINTGIADNERKGALLIYQALEGIIIGLILAGSLYVVDDFILSAFNVKLDLNTAEKFYGDATWRMINYVVDLSETAAELGATVLLGPLATVWIAASGLANISGQYLVALMGTFQTLSALLISYGKILVSVGVTLTAVPKLRRLGPPLVIGVIVLSSYLCGVQPIVDNTLSSLEYSHGSVPVISAVVEYLMDGVGKVLRDSVRLIGLSVTLSFFGAIIVMLIAALSEAIGGFARSIALRLW